MAAFNFAWFETVQKEVGKDTPDMSFNSNISTQARLRLLVGRQGTREKLFQVKNTLLLVSLFMSRNTMFNVLSCKI